MQDHGLQIDQSNKDENPINITRNDVPPGIIPPSESIHEGKTPYTGSCQNMEL